MIPLSSKQQELQDRDAQILASARKLLLDRGYYGLTMDHIARESAYPKGTLYHRFGCKEDILIALTTDCSERRMDMMRRAAAYPGRTRERMLALGEAVSLYTRLYPDDSRILHSANGPVREKASPQRLMALLDVEREATQISFDILQAAVEEGDIVPEYDDQIAEIALGTWGLVEGAFTLIESGNAKSILNVDDPFHKVWRYFNRVADSYGWRPLFDEWDYEESLVHIRKSIFPTEAQDVYGKDKWYGDRL